VNSINLYKINMTTYLDNSYHWYALYTKSNAEKRLFNDLCKRDIEAYLPTQKIIKQWSDRLKIIEQPLFKSYLFVKVSNKEYFKALNCIGAVRYVSFSGLAIRIPEAQISSLKCLVQIENVDINNFRSSFSKGQKVKVIQGPLTGVFGNVIRLKGLNKLVISFEAIGSVVCVDIDTTQVQPVDSIELNS